MCAYSMIADHYGDKWRQQYPWMNLPGTLTPSPQSIGNPYSVNDGPTKAEFEALRREVADLKELLTKAKEYDERTGQPDCGAEDKTAILRAVAKFVGIDIESALPKGV